MQDFGTVLLAADLDGLGVEVGDVFSASDVMHGRPRVYDEAHVASQLLVYLHEAQYGSWPLLSNGVYVWQGQCQYALPQLCR